MSIGNKLNQILECKGDIADAINQKGGLITEDTPLSQYANKINQLKTKAPPELISLNVGVQLSKTATIEGQTEFGVNVILLDPNNASIPVTLNLDGSFIANLNANFLEGEYTLKLIDQVGNEFIHREIIEYLPEVDAITTVLKSDDVYFYGDFSALNTLYTTNTKESVLTGEGQPIGLIESKFNLGNAISLEQANITKRPILQKDNTTGKYYALFDMVDDILEQLNAPICTEQNGLTMIVATQYAVTSTRFELLSYLASASQYSLWCACIRLFNRDLITGILQSPDRTTVVHGLVKALPSVTPSTHRGGVFAYRFNSGFTKIKINESNTVSEFNCSPFGDLKGIYLKGYKVYKILIVYRELTDAEYNIVETEFKNTLGI